VQSRRRVASLRYRVRDQIEGRSPPDSPDFLETGYQVGTNASVRPIPSRATASYTRAVPPVVGSPLPDVERAIVPRQKLEDYLLDSAHEDGRHKARVFQSALGIAAADWRHLSEAILAGMRWR
jgi:hypothetical protein